ncbi:MAG: fructosamine kinase family protein [Burkholderiales bacterium]
MASSPSLWQEISSRISRAIHRPFASVQVKPVGGGCINSASRIEGNGLAFFVKLNNAAKLSMFEAEAAGLEEIARTHTVRVPQPICCGVEASQAFLVLEYIELGSRGDSSLLGTQLAQLHKPTSDKFGWSRDNTIGSTPQINMQSDDWIEFWRERRLGFQLSLAAKNGYSGALQKKGERLAGSLDIFFRDYQPQPSLLHGDLWGGNAAFDSRGNPVIFDPAVYYGDREADLAMTELFGGFGRGFYSAYREAFPLDRGYEVRKTLYNLYHVLNHLNLFGGSYLRQAEGMIDGLLAQV